MPKILFLSYTNFTFHFRFDYEPTEKFSFFWASNGDLGVGCDVCAGQADGAGVESVKDVVGLLQDQALLYILSS